MKRSIEGLAALFALAITVAGCRAGDARSRSESSTSSSSPVATAAPRAAVVDSAFPIEEQLRRFRSDLKEQPTAFDHAARSREELVKRFLDAVVRNDTTALLEMQLSRAEFAYLYYPESRFSRVPYELEPQLMWMQTSLRGDKGLGRLLKHYGGKRLEHVKLECLPDMKEGPTVVLTPRCQMHWREGGRPVVGELFGSIIRRDGLYKFVSYANKIDA